MGLLKPQETAQCEAFEIFEIPMMMMDFDFDLSEVKEALTPENLDKAVLKIAEEFQMEVTPEEVQELKEFATEVFEEFLPLFETPSEQEQTPKIEELETKVHGKEDRQEAAPTSEEASM